VTETTESPAAEDALAPQREPCICEAYARTTERAAPYCSGVAVVTRLKCMVDIGESLRTGPAGGNHASWASGGSASS